jgi:hypothetical protein
MASAGACVPLLQVIPFADSGASRCLQKLREWVAVQPQYRKKLVLLDFDALSKMKHAPTPLEGLDWHFQCIFNFEVGLKPSYAVASCRCSSCMHQTLITTWQEASSMSSQTVSRAQAQMHALLCLLVLLPAASKDGDAHEGRAPRGAPLPEPYRLGAAQVIRHDSAQTRI